MNLAQQREAALKAARAIAEAAQKEGRGFTDQERAEVDKHMAKAQELEAQIDAQVKDAGLLRRLESMSARGNDDEGDGEAPAAKSLGEHFVKSVGAEGLARVKNQAGYTALAPEFKAATDPHTVGDVFDPVLTDVDKTVVRAYRRPVVSDLFGTGTLSGTSITYFEESPTVEGGFTTVAEGGQKPQLHIGNPVKRIDSLTKIAAWWDTSDEMAEDLPFWVSEINNRGLYLLSMAEEAQLLNGDGIGSNLKGVLNRDGVQAQALGSDTPADAIFKALTKVQTATGYTADGIIINPADYEKLRLAKDGNSQYYGGGFFAGPYGNGNMVEQPPLWGTRTVVSSAVEAGTAVVGAFKLAATVYRKGGIQVATTNSDQGKFTSNILTTRIEERIALAVRVPAAIVKVSLTAGP